MANEGADEKPGLFDWVEVLVVPLSVAIAGGFFAFVSSSREAHIAEREVELSNLVSQEQLESGYVDLAAKILTRPLPSDEEADEQRAAEIGLRGWAVDVLTASSPVAIDDETARALESGDVLLPPPAGNVSSRVVFEEADVSAEYLLAEACRLVLREPKNLYAEASLGSPVVGIAEPGNYTASDGVRRDYNAGGGGLEVTWYLVASAIDQSVALGYLSSGSSVGAEDCRFS